MAEKAIILMCLAVNIFFFVKVINMAYTKNRNVFTWGTFGLFFSVIAYFILDSLKTRIIDPTHGQTIIPPDKIERVYQIKQGKMVIGNGQVILNGSYAPNGKFKIKPFLFLHVIEHQVSKISLF